MYDNTRRILGHAGTQGNWAFGHSGAQALEHSKGTWGLRHSNTWVQQTLEALYLADSFLSRCDEDISISQGKLYTTYVTFLTESLGIWYDRYKANNVELPSMLRFMLKNYLTQNLKNNIYWIQHVTCESSTVLKKTQCP